MLVQEEPVKQQQQVTEAARKLLIRVEVIDSVMYMEMLEMVPVAVEVAKDVQEIQLGHALLVLLAAKVVVAVKYMEIAAMLLDLVLMDNLVLLWVVILLVVVMAINISVHTQCLEVAEVALEASEQIKVVVDQE
jgi:hypothetical protein